MRTVDDNSPLRRRRTWVAIIFTASGLVILWLLLFPPVSRQLRMYPTDHIDAAERSLKYWYSVIEAYRSDHQGENPRRIQMDGGGMGSEEEKRLLKVFASKYNPEAQCDEIMMIYYGGTQPVAIWSTANGRVYIARLRLWPRWEVKERRLELQFR